MIIFGT